jgi:heme/copper-type cytochrome/quinol oxidase subunit 2
VSRAVISVAVNAYFRAGIEIAGHGYCTTIHVKAAQTSFVIDFFLFFLLLCCFLFGGVIVIVIVIVTLRRKFARDILGQTAPSE